MPEYRLAPAARQDLDAIWEYSFRRWGLDQAERYTRKLTDTFDALAKNPGLASTCGHIRTGYRRFLMERHVIYFRTEADGIKVMRILHERMNAKRQV